MEKGTFKETEVEVSTEKVGVKRKTKEILDKKGKGYSREGYSWFPFWNFVLRYLVQKHLLY
jgi:hypothetical protein